MRFQLTSVKARGVAAVVSALALVLSPGHAIVALASSHREAPYITEHPKVDAVDFYAFRSYEAGRAAFTTILANYQPLQVPGGGPNYFAMDPEALYEIHIDNTGDAKEDLTFQFRFTNTLVDTKLNIGGTQVSIPLLMSGVVAAGNDANLNQTESYTVKLVTGNRRTGTVANVTNAGDGTATFRKPFDYTGNKVFTNAAGYDAYAAQYLYNITIPGCGVAGKLFVGQREDPFRFNLGEVFDLVNTNPLGAVNAELNTVGAYNATTIALELPNACIVGTGNGAIGTWTTASIRQARFINPTPTYTLTAKEGGAWTQVSRLGHPLINEVIIGVPDKDKFNSSKPENDAQFATYVTNPTFPALLNILFGAAADAPTNIPRNDLVTVFLTGVAGVNQLATVTASEMLRLNTGIFATARGNQNNLGAAQCFSRVADAVTVALGGCTPATGAGCGLGVCDPAGFPNGRRPGDDIIDVTLRVAMGALVTAASAPDGASAFTDGATNLDTQFGGTFPYLNRPNPGSPSN